VILAAIAEIRIEKRWDLLIDKWRDAKIMAKMEGLFKRI
jgi:hypothetical protein